MSGPQICKGLAATPASPTEWAPSVIASLGGGVPFPVTLVVLSAGVNFGLNMYPDIQIKTQLRKLNTD